MILISASSFWASLFASALPELLDRVFALFDQRIQNSNCFAFIKRLHFVDFFILDRGLHHAQYAQSELILAAHRIGHMRLNFLLKSH